MILVNIMQAKRLKKLVESVLGWTVDDLTETDLDNEVSYIITPQIALLVDSALCVTRRVALDIM
jgi:hypothetical protein